MILNHFKGFPFIAGIIFGLLAIHFRKPEKRVVIEYPHPNDTESKVFKDRNGTCYTYSVHEVDCDANEGTLKEYPLQG